MLRMSRMTWQCSFPVSSAISLLDIVRLAGEARVAQCAVYSYSGYLRRTPLLPSLSLAVAYEGFSVPACGRSGCRRGFFWPVSVWVRLMKATKAPGC